MYIYVHKPDTIAPNNETNIMGIHIQSPSSQSNARQVEKDRKTDNLFPRTSLSLVK